MIALLDEVESVTENRELYAQIGEIMSAQDESASIKMNELYRKVISMSGRVDNAKKLADALKTCVTLEREVFGIANDRTPGQSLDDFLDALSNA